MNITISDRAKRQLAELGVGSEKFLRIRVMPGGCSGNSYSAAVDDALGKDDRVVFEEGSLRAVADPRSAVYLAGLSIDYSDDLIRSGFRFNNPNAEKACGCGASFATFIPGPGQVAFQS